MQHVSTGPLQARAALIAQTSAGDLPRGGMSLAIVADSKDSEPRKKRITNTNKGVTP